MENIVLMIMLASIIAFPVSKNPPNTPY